MRYFLSNLIWLLLWGLDLIDRETMWVIIWSPGVAYTEKGLSYFQGRNKKHLASVNKLPNVYLENHPMGNTDKG